MSRESRGGIIQADPGAAVLRLRTAGIPLDSRRMGVCAVYCAGGAAGGRDAGTNRESKLRANQSLNNMKNIESATSRELEIEQVKRSIVRTDEKIRLAETALRAMRLKQIGRHCEVARQEALAKSKP